MTDQLGHLVSVIVQMRRAGTFLPLTAREPLCHDGLAPLGKSFSREVADRGSVSMSGSGIASPIHEPQPPDDVPLELVSRLLDTLDRSLLVSERSGRVLMINSLARKCLDSLQLGDLSRLNLFTDLLEVDAGRIFADIEGGQQEIKLDLTRGEKKAQATIQWVPEPDRFVVKFETPSETPTAPDPATQITVQELLQEREITYRNLLAAYLKLQEVNRQKTVFLASAAHELKTPLAVIKGYYDLMLTGSLGRLSDKQKDIL